MKKIRIGLIVGAIAIIVAELTIIDYSNLIWSKNLSSFLVILAMIGSVAGLILSNRHDKKQQGRK